MTPPIKSALPSHSTAGRVKEDCCRLCEIAVDEDPESLHLTPVVKGTELRKKRRPSCCCVAAMSLQLTTGVRSPASHHCLLLDTTSTSSREFIVGAGEEARTPLVPRRRRNVKGFSKPCRVHMSTPAWAADRVGVAYHCPVKLSASIVRVQPQATTSPGSNLLSS